MAGCKPGDSSTNSLWQAWCCVPDVTTTGMKTLALYSKPIGGKFFTRWGLCGKFLGGSPDIMS